MPTIAKAASIYDLPKHQLAGFDAYLMPKEQTHYPDDLACESVWDLSDERTEAGVVGRLAMEAADKPKKMFPRGWDERNLVFAISGSSGWTYLLPVKDAETMIGLEDNLAFIIEEADRD